MGRRECSLRLRQREIRIVGEALAQVRPAPFLLHIEDVQVKAHDLGIVVLHQFGNAGVQTLVIENLGQIAVDGAFAIVQDAQRVAKGAEHGLMAGHEPGLEQVLAQGVRGTELQGLENPFVLIRHGLLGDVNRTKFAGIGQGGDAMLVNVFIVRPEPIEHLGHDGGIDGFVKIVRLHRMGACAVFGKISGLCKRQDDGM